MQILLGEDYEPDKLLLTDLSEALTCTLLPQADHKVEDCLTAQHLVAHVSAHHDR